MIDEYTVCPAGEGDWELIARNHAETIWSSLNDLRKQETSPAAVHSQVEKQIGMFRTGEEGNAQIFVVRDKTGKFAGFLWMEMFLSGFTGKHQAHISEIFVAQEFRGKGIGKLLMNHAETWALQKGLSAIGLNVAATNTAAIELYMKSGYTTDAFRMYKHLGEESNSSARDLGKT